MATPQVSGSHSFRTTSSSTATFDISGIANGSWMVVSVMSSVQVSGGQSITPPANWTVLANLVVSGTRSNYLFAKIKDAGDGNSAVFTQAIVGNTSYAILWGTGAHATMANWAVGTGWTRSMSAQTAGARYDTIAQSITTVTPDHLMVAISHEATNAMADQNEISAVSPAGWTERVYFKQFAPSDRIETIWMATKEQVAAGASGNVTVTYTAPHDSNSWGIQIAIPTDGAEPSPTPYVVGTPSTYTGTTFTGFTINRPLGAQTGDYVVVALRGQSSSTSVGPASSGFTRLGAAFSPSTNTYRLNGFYGRPIEDVGSEPSSYSFTFTAGETNVRFVATAFLVRNVNLEAPVSGFYDSYGGVSITAGMQVSSYNVASSPSLALFAGASELTAGNDHVPVTLPSGYSVINSVVSSTNLAGSRTYLWVGGRESNTSVPGASIVWGNAGGLGGPAAYGVALRSADSPTPDPAGEGYIAADGNGDEVKIFYTIEDNEIRTPSKVLPMLRGFSTVAEMLATPGFTWGHRGGSASWTEMSLYGYTQAVARGYGVLEISLARTSDGVWFGLHDQTTDRTSGGVFGNASSQTWAQIQMQQNVGGPGNPQPYMSWDELIAAYGHTHIIVADPKYALGSYRTEFLNMVNRDLGPTRAIIKYSGVGSGAANLSTAAQAMGFETWGFFYAADASVSQGGNGALQTWGASWTLLGMEYGASQAIWDEVLAFGKPVIGHIAPNQAAYNTAISKGAVGVQVSGVGVVAPVSWWTQ